jgi:dihydrofolate reductase
MKLCAFLATSLDGFIARSNGDIDWLEQANTLVPSGEDCGFSNFFNSVDCLVIGRKSFEKVLTFKEWPYGSKQVFVMSKKGIQIPPHLSATVHTTNLSPEDLQSQLSRLGYKKIYVDGGEIVRLFLYSGILDEITITRIPVIIHSGVPLFKSSADTHDPLFKDFWLELLDHHSWPFGFIQEVWRIKSKLSSQT